MNARSLARALGGDAINAYQVVCPGPGHSAKDRSLSVFLDPNSPNGFRVHPHAPGDDWRECRDYVRDRLGLPRSTVPQSSTSRSSARSSGTSSTTPAAARPETDRLAQFATAIWQEAR